MRQSLLQGARIKANKGNAHHLTRCFRAGAASMGATGRWSIRKSIARVRLVRAAHHAKHTTHHAHTHAVLAVAHVLVLRSAKRSKSPKNLKDFPSIAIANPPHGPVCNHAQWWNLLRLERNGGSTRIPHQIARQTGRRQSVATLGQNGPVGVGNSHIKNTGLPGGFCQQRTQPKHRTGA